jgi:hypothetical protein
MYTQLTVRTLPPFKNRPRQAPKVRTLEKCQVDAVSHCTCVPSHLTPPASKGHPSLEGRTGVIQHVVRGRGAGGVPTHALDVDALVPGFRASEHYTVNPQLQTRQPEPYTLHPVLYHEP